MFRSILVPIDFDVDGDRAAVLAGRLAAAAHLPVELLTVIDRDTDVPTSRFELEYRERLVGTAPTTCTVVVDDDVVGGLVTAIDARPASLVVLGTKARGPVGALLFGALSEAVLERTERPLLLVGPSAGGAIGPALAVAVTDGEAGDALLPVAVDWSRQVGVQPWFVQVDAPETPEWAAPVERLAQAARDLGVDAQWDVLHGGDPARSIESFIDGLGGGVIAVASRRWSSDALVHWASTARRLVHRAPYPVLVQPLARRVEGPGEVGSQDRRGGTVDARS